MAQNGKRLGNVIEFSKPPTDRDLALEKAIQGACDVVTYSDDDDLKLSAWRIMKALICRRSSAQVRRMELERGLTKS
jgi:hypothetical protein